MIPTGVDLELNRARRSAARKGRAILEEEVPDDAGREIVEDPTMSEAPKDGGAVGSPATAGEPSGAAAPDPAGDPSSSGSDSPSWPFTVRDCALLAIATGERAQTLRGLADRLQQIDPGSIYYHFWGGLLRPRFDDPEYNNDFAAWAHHALHDNTLAERLAVIDPAEFNDMDELRHEVIDVIEERIDETDYFAWATADQKFEFIRSQIVVFDSKKELKHPRELATAVPTLSVGSIFYHFIDARHRDPNGLDDFQSWLRDRPERYDDLRERIAGVDPYFISLVELRDQLTAIFQSYFGGGRR